MMMKNMKPTTTNKGGFAGFETSLDERDFRSNSAVLSGDLNGDDGTGFHHYDENSYWGLFSGHQDSEG